MEFTGARSSTLVLGDGGGRGQAPVGAWRGTRELGLRVERGVGSRAGALLGASIAAGLAAQGLAAERNVAEASVTWIRPVVSQQETFDLSQAERMMERGYGAALQAPKGRAAASAGGAR